MFNFQILVILIFAFSLFSFCSGDYPIFGVDEGRYAQASMNMLNSNNWLMPSVDGLPRLEKPIFFYWEQIISFITFGKTEFAARLPSILSATGMVYLAYILGAIQGTPIIAALILMSSLAINVFAKVAMTDMSLAFFISGSLSFFFLSYFHKIKANHIFNRQNINTRIYFYICAVFLALGFLCKGPIAVALPGLVITIFLLKEKELLSFFVNKKFDTLPFFIVFLIIVFPWYILIHLETNGEFTQSFFMRDNVGRFLSPLNSHSEPIWFYIPVILAATFPWAFFIPQAIFSDNANTKMSRVNITDHTNSLRSFALIWAFSFFIFFSLAQTKLITYIIPIILPLILLIAKYCSLKFNQESRQNDSNKDPSLYVSFILILISLPSIAVFVLSNFTSELGKIPGLDISFFMILICIFFSCALIIAITSIKENTKLGFMILITASILTIGLSWRLIGVPVLSYMDNGIKNFCTQEYQTGTQVYSYRVQRASLGFYCETEVKRINANKKLLKKAQVEEAYIFSKESKFQEFKSFIQESGLDFDSMFEIVTTNGNYVFFKSINIKPNLENTETE